MKKIFFIFLVASTGFAALPPLAQSKRELQALLSDPRFYESLGSGEQIQEILRTEGGYLVLTQEYALHVGIKYKESQNLAGPAQFELEFERAERRN